MSQRPHPAHIPREVAESSRRSPRLPAAEAWIATFKAELVDGRRFPSYEHAEHETLHWTGFYNEERLHKKAR